MRRRALPGFVLVSVAVAVVLAGATERDGASWPQFRGRNAAGVADGANLPDAWDGNGTAGILWKARDSRPRALEPRRVGRAGVRHDGDLVAAGRHVQARALRRGHGFRRRHRAQVAGAEPRPADAARSSGSAPPTRACRRRSATSRRRTRTRRRRPTGATWSRSSGRRASTPTTWPATSSGSATSGGWTSAPTTTRATSGARPARRSSTRTW